MKTLEASIMLNIALRYLGNLCSIPWLTDSYLHSTVLVYILFHLNNSVYMAFFNIYLTILSYAHHFSSAFHLDRFMFERI